MTFSTISLSSRDVPSDLVETCSSGSGFFYLSDHGIPSDLIAEVFSVSDDFFSNGSLEEKVSTRDRDGHTGWTGIGEEVLDPDNPDTQSQGDLKESFYLSLDVLQGESKPSSGLSAQKLPPTLSPHQARLSLLITHCRRICLTLLHHLEVALSQSEHLLTSQHTGIDDRLRLISYPSQSQNDQKGIRAGQHTDYGSLTLLFQSAIGGLQVYDSKSNTWIDVLPKEGCLVVNVADALEFWLGGLFESSLHRVVEPRVQQEQQQRLSMAYFCQPDPQSILSPLPLPQHLQHKLPSQEVWKKRCKEKGIPLRDQTGNVALTGGQHLAARLKASYA
ncbi:unnamed protein product [Sympodiomycopsis kandeliae]